MDIKPRLGGRSGTRRPHLVTAAVTPGWDGGDDDAMDREMSASQAVTAIYERHALGLTRLAFLMVGDRQTAEDVVQEAFCGLYRAWDRMPDHGRALGYVRSSVLSPLSLPGTLTEAQAPTLALSPDGAKLAVAYGGSGKPAVVQVITLATGQMRQWTSPPPAAAPVLGGPGAWTSDGRTLALGLMSVQPSGRIRSTPTQMRLLDTTAPGSSLAAASTLVTLRGAGGFPWPFITPDGTKLIGEMSHQPARTGTITESGALGVYSARTGTLLQVIGRWQQREPGPGILSHARQAVVWSSPSGSRLIVEMPRGKLNEVGILTGDTFRPLAHVARAPLLFAINSGGFQTSGGYVGFAW